MKQYVCDNDDCKQEWRKYSKQFYEFKITELPKEVIREFDLCEDCYKEFLRKNRGF